MRPLNKEQRHRKAATVEDSIYDAIRHADAGTNLLTATRAHRDEQEPNWEEICKHLEYAEQQLAAATVIVQAALKDAKALRDW